MRKPGDAIFNVSLCRMENALRPCFGVIVTGCCFGPPLSHFFPCGRDEEEAESSGVLAGFFLVLGIDVLSLHKEEG
jgi:hypothetical protein